MKKKYTLAILVSAYLCIQQDTPAFEAVTIDSSVGIGYGLAIGDVDGDGRPDILLADKKQFVWYRNGDWKKFILADSLSEFDNVCIAARDLDGDGKVEVAVGAQWNPAQTIDTVQSGAIYYLQRPSDPTGRWDPVKLPHEPTVHRMQWVRCPGKQFALVVMPLHGRASKNGEGKGARVLAYRFPADVSGPWKIDTLDTALHLSHNFDIVEERESAVVFMAGKEGIRQKALDPANAASASIKSTDPAGEIRVGDRSTGDRDIAATIEPMHGNRVSVYLDDFRKKVILDDGLAEGHALAVGDVLGRGSNQVIAGWRKPDAEGRTGIKLYVRDNGAESRWTVYWIDENGMACEDLRVADLDGDGKADIIAAGRSTHNLKVYWNRAPRKMSEKRGS